MDLPNGHARANANEVYSEWGTASEPESVTMDFRKLSKLSLIKVPAEPFDHQWLIGTQSDGELVNLEVNDLVKPALKRILANASAHPMEIRLDETAATYNVRGE